MALFKQTWNFTSIGSNPAQWSEVMYLSSDNLPAAATIAPAVLKARLALLNTLNRITKIRVSQVGSPRVTTIVALNQQGMEGSSGPAPIDSAIVCNLASTVAPGRRKVWLRGWNAGDAYRDATSGVDEFSASLLRRFGTWVRALAAAQYCILTRVPPSVPGYGYVPVLAVDGTHANGTSSLYLNATGAPAIGTQLIMSKFPKKDFPALTGIFTVSNSGVVPAGPYAGKFFADIPYRTVLDQLIVSPGARVRAYANPGPVPVIDPAACQPEYIGGRKSKAPFSGSRGARSAARGLRLQD